MGEQIQNILAGAPANGATVRVQEVIRQVHEELRQLLQQRADVTRRIGTVKKTVAGLASLFGEGVLNGELRELLDQGKPGRSPGFTKTCRTILMEADSPLNARDICDRIRQRAPAMMERHKDPIASVTTVLNRLVDYGEAERVRLCDNRRGWQWVAESSGRLLD
jgi:chorismate mutase